MKKTALLLSILFICLNLLFAQQKEGIMTFKKTRHDYGNLTQDSGYAESEFVFVNTGIEPIIISRILNTCGCIICDWSRIHVASGDSGLIRITFNPINRPGYFHKTLNVVSNAKNSPVAITVTGKVLEKEKTKEQKYPHEIDSLRINTVHINFATICTDEVETQTIKMYNPSNGDLKVSLKKELLPKYLKVEVEPETLKPDSCGIIAITYDAGKVNDWDYVRASFFLFINDKRINDRKMNVSAIVKERFTEEEMKNPPVIEFDNTVFDFGTIALVNSVTHEFHFKIQESPI